MSVEYSQDHVLYQQGRDFMEKGDFVRALENLKKSAELFPHFKTYECIGICLLEQKNYSEAVTYLSASAGLGRKQSKSYFLLAKALVEIKQIDWAREKLDQALAINPDYKEAKDLLTKIS